MRGSTRKRGTFWEYTVDLGNDPITNKRKRKSKSGFKTKKECEAAMNELINQVNSKDYFEPEKVIFKSYATDWLNESKLSLREKTVERYTIIINKHIIPSLGNIEISKIKESHITDLYNKCLNNNCSLTTLKLYHSLLKRIFDKAVKYRIIKYNPISLLEKPKAREKEFNTWTVNQTNLFLDRVKNTSLYIVTLLAITTGMRRGELCGLRWENIDLDKGEVYIKEQLQEIDGELKVCPPKTQSSRRRITLLEYTIPILREYKKSKEDYLKSHNLKCDYVLCTYKGEPCNPNLITKKFTSYGKKIMQELGLPVLRFHDLRHTHATQLLLINTHPKVVAERLGHSTTAMTLEIYSHSIPSMQNNAANNLNNLYIE